MSAAVAAAAAAAGRTYVVVVPWISCLFCRLVKPATAEYSVNFEGSERIYWVNKLNTTYIWNRL